MPIYSRKQLRQALGRRFLYDTFISNTTGSPYGNSGVVGSFIIIDARRANLSYSGQDLFLGSYLHFSGAYAAGSAAIYPLASYNAGSGAFVFVSWVSSTPGSGSEYEIHSKIPPLDKHQAIDDTITRMRIRQEVGINTVDGALVYTIDDAASPNYLERILDVHLMANPNNSLDLDLRHMQDWQVVTTATGRELRLKWGVKGSQQIIFDAILIPSLGGDEDSTINLPDERWVLAGAAMRCYDFMIQNAPGQQVNQLMQRRAEMAAEYTRLSAKFMPTYEEPIRLHDVIRGMTPRPWDSASNFW